MGDSGNREMMLRDWNSEFRGSRVSCKEDKLNIALLGQQCMPPAQKPLPDLAPGSCLSPQLSISLGSEGPCISAAVHGSGSGHPFSLRSTIWP